MYTTRTLVQLYRAMAQIVLYVRPKENAFGCRRLGYTALEFCMRYCLANLVHKPSGGFM